MFGNGNPKTQNRGELSPRVKGEDRALSEWCLEIGRTQSRGDLSWRLWEEAPVLAGGCLELKRIQSRGDLRVVEIDRRNAGAR